MSVTTRIDSVPDVVTQADRVVAVHRLTRKRHYVITESASDLLPSSQQENNDVMFTQ
jgi:hypothetical protein